MPFDSGNDSSGMLAEHDGPKRTGDDSDKDYQPTPEEERTIKLVRKLFQKAKSGKDPYAKDWLDRYKLFRGDQWKEKRPSYRNSEVVNITFQAIQSQVPMMADPRPRFDFLPQEPQDIYLI